MGKFITEAQHRCFMCTVTFCGVGGEGSGNKTLMKCSNTLREKAKKLPFKFAFQIPDVGLFLFSHSSFSFRKQEAENGVSEPRRQLPVTLSCLKMFADAFQCLWWI